MDNGILNGEVISVKPSKVIILVDKLEDGILAEQKLKVGSYLQINDNEDHILMALIESFRIEAVEGKDEPKYIIEATPLGVIEDGKFERGGDSITIPPKGAEPASAENINRIFSESVETDRKFIFSKLASNKEIVIPVDGNKFFNKHIAIVGSSGSGKSHTVAKVIQEVTKVKKDESEYMNNSHIFIFDIHSEYANAFPDARSISIENLILPYWLLNSEELEELFIDSEANDYNQRNVFKEAILKNKVKFNTEIEQKYITYDSPLFFDINEVLHYIKNRNCELADKGVITWEINGQVRTLKDDANDLFEGNVKFKGNKTNTLNGRFINFVSRLENKLTDKRLDFLVGEKVKDISFENTMKQILGYKFDDDSNKSNHNVTIIDLSAIPFEVLSITVSLISRIIFEYGYYHKKLNEKSNKDIETPILVVYEEAHKYAPKSNLIKYRASSLAIERIAKEGRKYGVTLALVTQRPSEVSETIFSQCNNFIAMRLTNPDDQNYVKRLLPDALGELTNKLPSLKAGRALLIGEAVVMPSVVVIDECEPKPKSNDVPYLDLWKEQWKEVSFEEIIKSWKE